MINIDKVLKEEIKYCFDFFYETSSRTEKGYGLCLDRTNDLERCSIASVGFALATYVIGCENNYVKKEIMQEHVKKTLNTLLNNVDHYKGFFAHFVSMEDGSRLNNCEFSTIDTALCLEGILTCQSYFIDDQEIQELSQEIFERVEYEDFIFERDNKLFLHMAYNDKKKGAQVVENQREGYSWHWEHYAEQMMMYNHMAAQDRVSEDVLTTLYNSFERDYDQESDVVYSPGGSMFIYEFCMGFFDYRKYKDMNGFDHFENSKKAVYENYKFCVEQKRYKGVNEFYWGLSAGDTKNGYRVYGAKPLRKVLDPYEVMGDGTLQQYAILGAINYHPEIVKKSIEKLVSEHPESIMKYGFSDGMNFNQDEAWFCENFLGIDKGITALMLDNYYNETVWKYYMENKNTQKAIEKLKYIKK